MRQDGVELLQVGGRRVGLGQGATQFGGHGPPAAVVGALVQVAVEQVHHQAGGEVGRFQVGGEGRVVQVADGARKQLVAACAVVTDLGQHRFELAQIALVAGGHHFTVPDHAAHGVGRLDDFVERRAERGGVRQQAFGDGFVELLQDAGADLGEGHVQGHHHLALPARGAGVALVALRGVGLRQVFAPAVDAQFGLAGAVHGHAHAARDPGLIGTGQHAVVAVEQQDVVACVVAVAGLEDAAHFVFEAEDQAEHPDDLLGLRVQHALGVDQGGAGAGTQVGGAEGFHVGLAGQRGGDQWVAAAFDGRERVDVGEHGTLGVQQDDLLVDGVLVTVGTQALHGTVAVGAQAGDVLAQLAVGGQEADVGGALVEVADHDVDDVAGLGANLGHDVVHALAHQAVNEVALQALEALAGGSDHRQQAAGVVAAVHLGHGFDHAPHQVEFAQRGFAAHHIAHVRQVVVQVHAQLFLMGRRPCSRVGHADRRTQETGQPCTHLVHSDSAV